MTTVIDSDDSLPSVKLNHPIASVLKCESRLFICIGEVNNLTLDSKHVDQILIDVLLEPLAVVGFQLLYIVPADCDDDPSLQNDWRWSFRRGTSYQVPGRLVEPVNPSISIKEAGRPCYLFESRILQSMGSLLLERLGREDVPRIPIVPQSSHFPYREANGMYLTFVQFIYCPDTTCI